MSTQNASQLPVVTARIGDTLAAVRNNSTYTFDFSRLTDDDLSGVTTPCVFTYGGQNGFTLPPTRFVSIDSIAATVVSIRASPQLEYLDQAKILALADANGEIIASAGWQRSGGSAISREELLLRLRDPSGPEQQDWIIGGFMLGPVQIDLRLRRVHRKKGFVDSLLGSGDLFLLNVQCRDDQLAKWARQEAYRLRELDGVPIRSMGRRINLDQYVARLKPPPAQ